MRPPTTEEITEVRIGAMKEEVVQRMDHQRHYIDSQIHGLSVSISRLVERVADLEKKIWELALRGGDR